MLAILILAACALLVDRLTPAEPPVSGRARISDGDSFHLGAERVRLLGIDAPELDQTCTDAQGGAWPCGRVARDRLTALVAGQSPLCRPQGHDRFGRILATCEVSKEDLGAAMVAAGLAISADDYGAEEGAARRAKRGLWAGTFIAPRTWRDSHGREAEERSGWDWLPRF